MTEPIFGEGFGPILFSNVACNGNEFKLFDCANAVLDGVSSCSHRDDAGVMCQAGKLANK